MCDVWRQREMDRHPLPLKIVCFWVSNVWQQRLSCLRQLLAEVMTAKSCSIETCFISIVRLWSNIIHGIELG